MEISNSVLAGFLRRCSGTISWGEKEQEQIYPSLRKICLLNGGRIVGQGDTSAGTAEAFFLDRLEKGIDKIVRHYSRAIETDPEKEKYYSRTKDSPVPFNSLAPSAFIDQVDVNTANAKELEQIENIGRVKAAEIVQYREKYGYFRSLEELTRVKGIGPAQLKILSYAAKAIQADEKPIFISPLLLQFKKEPTLANYLKVIKETGGIFSSTKQPAKLREELVGEKEYKKTIILEFMRMADYLAANAHPRYGNYGSTSGKEIRAWDERIKKVRNIERSGATDTVRIAILDDTDYFPLVLEMLQKAKKRIRVIMFLIRITEKKENAPRLLLEALASKKKAGVGVKVILDRSGEKFNPHIDRVNKAAVDFLRRNGVPLLLDREEVKTHTKLVLIDKEHTIVGSHNWTSGSLFRYDDKSVYVQSGAFCAKLSRRFDGLWSEYGKIGQG